MNVRALVAIFALLLAGVSCAHHVTAREHALLLVAHGSVKQGTRELEGLRDRAPNDPRAWIDLGHAYELGHRYDEALDAYDHAADVAPKLPDGPREGGLRAAAWGEWAAAKPRLEAAILRGDDDPTTFHALGFVLTHLDDRAGAKRAYLAGVASPRGGDDATCVLGLATLAVGADDATDALKWYDELARRRPDHAGARFGRAWALAKLGRYEDAEHAIVEARSLGGAEDQATKMRAFIAELRAKTK